LKIIEKLIKYLTESIGISTPTTILRPSSDKIFEGTAKEKRFTIGVFNQETNEIYFNQDRVSVFMQGDASIFDSRTVEDDFYKVASKIYHETRHAEQCFRGVQYSIQVLKKEPPVKIKDTILLLARSTPLPSSRMVFAKQMHTEFFTPNNVPYYQQAVEVDAYMFSKSVYRGLHDNKPPKVNSGKDWNADAFSYIDSLPPLDKNDFEYSKSIKLTKNAQGNYDVYFGKEKRNVRSIRNEDLNKPGRDKDADRAIIKSHSDKDVLDTAKLITGLRQSKTSDIEIRAVLNTYYEDKGINTAQSRQLIYRDFNTVNRTRTEKSREKSETSIQAARTILNKMLEKESGIAATPIKQKNHEHSL
jgi:hypothetical protein